MRAHYLVLVLVLLGADTPPPSGGTITGTVVAVKDGKPVARDDVYVYLEPAQKPRRRKSLPGDGQKREIVQKDERFVPRVLVVPAGTEVWFPNVEVKRESNTHNVFSPTDPIFDLGRYGPDKKGKSHRFVDVEEFDIFCDIHPRMWAKVKAVDSAHIAPVVGGRFKLANVPPGTYKVVAWVRNSPEVRSNPVVLTAGATVALDRELHLQVKTRSGCHDRKDGTPYPAQYGKPCPEDY
jgi:plastocyanin